MHGGLGYIKLQIYLNICMLIAIMTLICAMESASHPSLLCRDAIFVPNGLSWTRQQSLIYALARHLSIQMFEVAETIVIVVRERPKL